MSKIPQPPPAFPSAESYGGLSLTNETPNPYDLSDRFNSLNITPQSIDDYEGDWRVFPQRQNSDVNKPLPSVPAPSTSSPQRPPIPNVLTPGSRYGLMQSDAQPPSIDYLPPLRNPVPRPPQMVPRRDDFGLDPYSMTPYTPPIIPQAHSAPPKESPLSNPWNNQPMLGSSAEPYTGRPSLSAPNSSALAPTRIRASSVPPASSVSSSTSVADGVTQCAGVTKSNKRCSRLVKAPPALGFLNPEDEIPRYCHQHAKEMLAVTGFYSRSTKAWVEFDDWIPAYLSEDTKVLLRSDMEKPISNSDVDGYIYCYELRDTKNKDIINLKVGRAVNLVKRIDEWTKSCESKEPILRGWYPGPDRGDHAEISLMKGKVQGESKGKNCHRLERLIHLELADLVINKAYLTPEFDGASVSATADKAKPTAKTKTKTKAKAAEKDKNKKPRKKSKVRVDSDEDEDDDDFEENDDDEDETLAPPSPVTSRSKPRMKVQIRPPCKDCGQVHKEIFTFTRPTEGRLKGHEWEKIVHPVIEKWGGFVDNYT
ncbi:hypothetical protein FRB96_005190 [Tulasnella sp. 330]|nr:hypothetical protein FRB96_005190 [Tulasnella sp. 330]KAG8884855.1 hypothetical protein FRB97_003062 [Tulasnella sp. 331]KAG8890113.1 hypothetical protein FRB98_000841 [Tulasnella sp. 332]